MLGEVAHLVNRCCGLNAPVRAWALRAPAVSIKSHSHRICLRFLRLTSFGQTDMPGSPCSGRREYSCAGPWRPAPLDADDHALAVDVGRPQGDGIGDELVSLVAGSGACLGRGRPASRRPRSDATLASKTYAGASASAGLVPTRSGVASEAGERCVKPQMHSFPVHLLDVSSRRLPCHQQCVLELESQRHLCQPSARPG